MQTCSTPQKFDDGQTVCLIALLVLGNYFAFIGLRYSKAARRFFSNGQFSEARHAGQTARAWALYGLIPSTLINLALIYALCLWLWRIYEHQFQPILNGLM